MKQNKLIETSDMSSTLTDEGKRTDGVSFGEGYSIVMNTLSVGVENWTKLHVPYRTAEFRILLITEGSCRFYFNLMDTFLRAGDVLLLKLGCFVNRTRGKRRLTHVCYRSTMDYPNIICKPRNFLSSIPTVKGWSWPTTFSLSSIRYPLREKLTARLSIA